MTILISLPNNPCYTHSDLFNGTGELLNSL